MVTDDFKLSGYPIPKGTTFLINFYGNHHNPDIWEDPETFDPNRFSPDREKYALLRVHVYSLSLSLSLFLSLSLSVVSSLYSSLSLTRSLPLSLSLSLTTHSCTHSLSHTHTCTLTHSLHARTHALSLSFFPSLPLPPLSSSPSPSSRFPHSPPPPPPRQMYTYSLFSLIIVSADLIHFFTVLSALGIALVLGKSLLW